ncbi:hypothetical protein EDB80DRAFT_601269, partial [Ilyonectria destructans]
MGGGRLDGDPYCLWKPPRDPRRPEFPYHRGLDLSIRRHVPPPPFGVGYIQGQERQESPPQPIREVTQSEWCLQHPPADAAPHPDTTSHNLHILDEIACGDGRGSQVVRCWLDQEDQVYVAKIYDPLYYSYTDAGTPVDVTWLADLHYSRESAAYEDLKEAKVDGQLVPNYHGSWTFDLALLDSETRPVRMILIGWIQGVDMYSLVQKEQVTSFPPQQRLDILARAMEIETKLAFYGVHHRDFSPRNIMLVGPFETQVPQVFLIDLNHSVVTSRPNSKYPKPTTTRPVSPHLRQWGGCGNEFLCWVPQPHRSRPRVFKGWLKSTWENSDEFDIIEGLNLTRSLKDRVVITPPVPDVKPEDPALYWR